MKQYIRFIVAAGAALLIVAPIFAQAQVPTSGQPGMDTNNPPPTVFLAPGQAPPGGGPTAGELRMYQVLYGLPKYSHKADVEGYLSNNRLAYQDDGGKPATLTVKVEPSPQNYLLNGTLTATFKFDQDDMLLGYVVKESKPGETNTTPTPTPTPTSNALATNPALAATGAVNAPPAGTPNATGAASPVDGQAH